MTEDEKEKIEELHYAAQNSDLETVKKLVESGVDINAFDEDLDWTALHAATIGENIEIIKFLIKQGADINAHKEEKIGETPLGLVAQNCSYEIAKILINAGANPTIPGWMQITALARAEKRKKPEGVRIYELLQDAAEKFQ